MLSSPSGQATVHGGHAGVGGVPTLVSPALAGAVRLAASKTSPDLDWDTLATLPPMRCAARLLGVISNCAGYSASFFSNRAGTPIGHSLTALCVDWEILPHRDAIRQDSDSLGAAVRASGKNLSDIAKRWTFEGVDQKLTAALAQSCGSTAPLKLWAYVNLWPRDLAEKLKSELLKEIYTEDGEVDRTCELLAWTHLTQSGKGLTAEERKAIDTQYPRWMAACSRVLDKMVQARQKYQSLTDPKLSVVGLLEEWATLPSLAGHGRRGRVTSLLEKERKLYTKLDAHPEGTTLSWVTRKACYLSILKAFPRVKRSGESFIMLFQSVKSSQSYEEVLDVLSRHAYKSGYKDADELLGGGDEDRAQATTNGKREHRDDDIPRPKFRPPNSRNGRERREKRPDPQAVLTSKSPGSSEQGRKRPTSFFATEQDGPAKKRSRLTAIDHAKANGVTESLAKERVEKGQCAICGSADHFARACPKNSRSATKPGGTRSHEDSRKTNRDETVLLTMGKAEVLAGTVEVSTPGPAVGGRSRLVHARAGFDTMCSQNLITKGIVDLLEATPVEGEQVRLQTAGGIREANEWVTLSVKRPGFRVQLPLLVVDSLPGVDLLVRKADLSYLGYQIVDRKFSPVNRSHHYVFLLAPPGRAHLEEIPSASRIKWATTPRPRQT